MAVYRVWIKQTNYGYTDIDAESEEEAYEIASDMGLDEFIEDTYPGDFEITEVKRCR